MRKAPCIKECPYRSPTCHSECEKYLEWSAERAHIRYEINKETKIWISDRYKRTQRWHKNHNNHK